MLLTQREPPTMGVFLCSQVPGAGRLCVASASSASLTGDWEMFSSLVVGGSAKCLLTQLNSHKMS